MKEAVTRLLREQPFQPFEVRMSNGDNFQVRHPEMALIVKHGVVIGSADSDDFHICPYLHIASIKTNVLPSANGGATDDFANS